MEKVLNFLGRCRVFIAILNRSPNRKKVSSSAVKKERKKFLFKKASIERAHHYSWRRYYPYHLAERTF